MSIASRVPAPHVFYIMDMLNGEQTVSTDLMTASKKELRKIHFLHIQKIYKDNACKGQSAVLGLMYPYLVSWELFYTRNLLNALGNSSGCIWSDVWFPFHNFYKTVNSHVDENEFYSVGYQKSVDALVLDFIELIDVSARFPTFSKAMEFICSARNSLMDVLENIIEDFYLTDALTHHSLWVIIQLGPKLQTWEGLWAEYLRIASGSEYLEYEEELSAKDIPETEGTKMIVQSIQDAIALTSAHAESTSI